MVAVEFEHALAGRDLVAAAHLPHDALRVGADTPCSPATSTAALERRRFESRTAGEPGNRGLEEVEQAGELAGVFLGRSSSSDSSSSPRSAAFNDLPFELAERGDEELVDRIGEEQDLLALLPQCLQGG